MPVRHDADPDDMGGRGLMIIDGLAKDWGAYRKADGKVVWVMVSPPGRPVSQGFGLRLLLARLLAGFCFRHYQAGLVGEHDRLSPVAESEFGEDAGDVGFHGRFAEG
jgi:hypothetical protein